MIKIFKILLGIPHDCLDYVNRLLIFQNFLSCKKKFQNILYSIIYNTQSYMFAVFFKKRHKSDRFSLILKSVWLIIVVVAMETNGILHL